MGPGQKRVPWYIAAPIIALVIWLGGWIVSLSLQEGQSSAHARKTSVAKAAWPKPAPVSKDYDSVVVEANPRPLGQSPGRYAIVDVSARSLDLTKAEVDGDLAYLPLSLVGNPGDEANRQVIMRAANELASREHRQISSLNPAMINQNVGGGPLVQGVFIVFAKEWH